MNYDENVFKEKANIKARRIWLVFALLLTANYGSDAATNHKAAVLVKNQKACDRKHIGKCNR